MKRRRRIQILVLFCLLLVAGLLTFAGRREIRRGRLSAELIATVKAAQAWREEVWVALKNDPTAAEAYTRYQEERKHRRMQAEAKVARLLQEGADPNAHELDSVHRSLWQEIAALLRRTFRAPSMSLSSSVLALEDGETPLAIVRAAPSAEAARIGALL